MRFAGGYRCWFCNQHWTRKGTTPERHEEGTCSMFGEPCSVEVQFFEKTNKRLAPKAGAADE